MRNRLIVVSAIGIICILFSITACETDEPLAATELMDVRLVIPDDFPQPVYTFDLNPISQEGFILGRKLFYEPKLSKDNSTSCGSCHQQFAAFSHLDHHVSHGVYGLTGKRNAPGLFNLIWQKELMWDGGVHNLEVQPLAPITNPVEMDETLPGVILKLQSDTEYPSQFKAVFGSDTITSQRMFRAIVQFMGLMISSRSNYDKYLKDETVFTEQQKNGLQLFRQKCESCHHEPLFTDLTYRNNGLDFMFSDSGRATITLNPNDMGTFKVPSLRNIGLTSPYMHDGRFNDLSDVLEHYRTGIKLSATLDTALFNGIQMTDSEKEDIISFLHTLSDFNFISDSRFSEPN